MLQLLLVTTKWLFTVELTAVRLDSAIDGKLAGDELFLLNMHKDSNEGSWVLIQVGGIRPGKRYGHSMCFNNDSIFLFGGADNLEAKNDMWVLNISKVPFNWYRVEFTGTVPSERLYHSSSACSKYNTESILMIFGGLDESKTCCNDMWILSKKGNWSLVKYKDEAVGRYQVNV
jgi:hypothetical protein